MKMEKCSFMQQRTQHCIASCKTSNFSFTGDIPSCDTLRTAFTLLISEYVILRKISIGESCVVWKLENILQADSLPEEKKFQLFGNGGELSQSVALIFALQIGF